MVSRKITIQNEHGLHARVATQLAKMSKGLDSKITICKDCTRADGCSVLQLLLLGAGRGSEIELIIEGGRENENLRTVTRLFSEGEGI